MEARKDLLDGEPDFFSGIESVGSTEDTVMADHCFESGIMAVEPIDHESTI
jgi:hypothetical protein